MTSSRNTRGRPSRRRAVCCCKARTLHFGENIMIDHVGFSVSDYAPAKAFYEKALAPLGYTLVMEATAEQAAQPAAGFGSGGKPDFCISRAGPSATPAATPIPSKD